jgi:hypothetical protein
VGGAVGGGSPPTGGGARGDDLRVRVLRFGFGGPPCPADLEGGGGGSRRFGRPWRRGDVVAPPVGRSRTGGGSVTGSRAARHAGLGRAGSPAWRRGAADRGGGRGGGSSGRPGAIRVRKVVVAGGGGSRAGGAAVGSRWPGLVEEAAGLVVGMTKKEAAGW